MRLLLLNFVAATALIIPIVLGAQSPNTANPWAIAGGLGVGAALVPESSAPVYFDATQITARIEVQRSLGRGLFGGAAMMATLGTEGGDCVGIGPCAPQFRHHWAKATLSYVHRNALRQWIPVASLGAGFARLPETAGTPARSPAVNTMLLSGSVDMPLLVGARSALLAGWESSVLPNAPGGRVFVHTLVLTARLFP